MRRIVLMAMAIMLMVALAAPAAFAAEKKGDANKKADGDLNRKQENRLEHKLDKAQENQNVVYLVDADLDLDDLYDFDDFYAYGQMYSSLDLLDCPFWGDYEGIVNQYDCYS